MFMIFVAAAIPRQLARRVQFVMSGESDVVKAANCVPHDVGDPGRLAVLKNSLIPVSLLLEVFNLLSTIQA